MPYSLDVNDAAQPLDSDQALVLGGEVRALKAARSIATTMVAAVTLTRALNGTTFYHAEVTTRTFSLPSAAIADPDIPVGSKFKIVNGPGAGTITINKSGTVTLLLNDTANPDGAFTTIALVANGTAFIELIATDVWHVYGSGLTGT
jgi:hypothetical protein